MGALQEGPIHALLLLLDLGPSAEAFDGWLGRSGGRGDGGAWEPREKDS